MNQGVKQANGDNLFILNPDTLVIEDSLSKLLLFSYQQNHKAIIGPSLISKLGKIQQSFWGKPTLLNTINSIFHLDYFNYKKNYKNKKIESYLEVDSVSGGAMFTTSETFKLLNGFNENLFWMEDIDYCIRAKKIRKKILYLPETKIIHYQGKSAQHNLKVAISNQLLSKIKFFDIHHSPGTKNILAVAIFIIAIIKSIFFIILSPFGPVYRNKLSGYLIVVRSILFDFQLLIFPLYDKGK